MFHRQLLYKGVLTLDLAFNAHGCYHKTKSIQLLAVMDVHWQLSYKGGVVKEVAQQHRGDE